MPWQSPLPWPIPWTQTLGCEYTIRTQVAKSPSVRPLIQLQGRNLWLLGNRLDDRASRAGRGTRLHGCAGRTRSGRFHRRRPGRQESGRARGSSSNGVFRASYACATAAGTWRPRRWAPPHLRRTLRNLRRRVRGRSRRSRDRTIRGVGMSARRPSAPSRSGSTAVTRPTPGLPGWRPSPAPAPCAGASAEAPEQPTTTPREDISTMAYPRTFLLWFDTPFGPTVHGATAHTRPSSRPRLRRRW